MPMILCNSFFLSICGSYDLFLTNRIWQRWWNISPVITSCHDSFLLLLLLSHFSCVQLCNPIDSSPPGSPVAGILQARTLEWVAISFSNAWKWKVKVKSLSRVWLLVTLGLQCTRLLHPWDFPGKSTEVGCHCLLLRSIGVLIIPNTPIILLWYNASCSTD